MQLCPSKLQFVLSLFPHSLCFLLVYSKNLTEVRVAGSSCVWDVPVIQCCLLFLFHCQLLSALTSVDSQPFLVAQQLRPRNMEPFMYDSAVLAVIKLYYVRHNTQCGVIVLWHLPEHKWVHKPGCLSTILGQRLYSEWYSRQRLLIHIALQHLIFLRSKPLEVLKLNDHNIYLFRYQYRSEQGCRY